MRAVKRKGKRRVNGLHHAPDVLTAAASGQTGKVVPFDLGEETVSHIRHVV